LGTRASSRTGERPVARGGLQGVAHGVPEVEQRPQPRRLPLVPGHDLRLDRHRPRDHGLQRAQVLEAGERLQLPLEALEERPIPDESVLDRLHEPRPALPLGERAQRLGVATKPAKSITTPPPRATITASRSNRPQMRRVYRRSAHSSDLQLERPAGVQLLHGAIRDDRGPRARRVLGVQFAQALEPPRLDVDGVAPGRCGRQLHPDLAHRVPFVFVKAEAILGGAAPSGWSGGRPRAAPRSPRPGRPAGGSRARGRPAADAAARGAPRRRRR